MILRGFQHQFRGVPIRKVAPGLGNDDNIDTITFGNPPERRTRPAIKMGPIVIPIGRWSGWQPYIHP